MEDNNAFIELMGEYGRPADFWRMFEDADQEGAAAVRETYAKLAFTICASEEDYINLCLTLDARANFHALTDIERAGLYYDLWREADKWAAQVLGASDLEKYYNIDFVARMLY